MKARVVRNLGVCVLLVAGCLVALASPASALVRVGRATPFYLQANTHYCMGTTNRLVVVARCNGSANQAWYPVEPYKGEGSYDMMFQQKSTGLCLQPQTGSKYSVATTAPCHDQNVSFTGNQTWFNYGGSRFANTRYYRSTHTCIGVTAVSNNHAVQMVPCNLKDLKQGWNKSA